MVFTLFRNLSSVPLNIKTSASWVLKMGSLVKFVDLFIIFGKPLYNFSPPSPSVSSGVESQVLATHLKLSRVKSFAFQNSMRYS